MKYRLSDEILRAQELMTENLNLMFKSYDKTYNRAYIEDYIDNDLYLTRDDKKQAKLYFASLIATKLLEEKNTVVLTTLTLENDKTITYCTDCTSRYFKAQMEGNAPKLISSRRADCHDSVTCDNSACDGA